MKAGIIFTGTGPILILTVCESFNDPTLIRNLTTKGIHKFIAYEVPVDDVKQRYGQHFAITLGDFRQTDELRVVDCDGQHIFTNFSMEELGEPIHYDGTTLRRAA
jgi:hypothetical protein